MSTLWRYLGIAILVYSAFWYVWYINGGPVNDNRKKPYIGPVIHNTDLQFNYYSDLGFR